VASLSVYSQPVNQVFEEWVTSDGTQNYFIKAAVETDGDGFVYVAGATLNNAGNYDLLVSKYDDGGHMSFGQINTTAPETGTTQRSALGQWMPTAMYL
jgi:hypothetical protein